MRNRYKNIQVYFCHVFKLKSVFIISAFFLLSSCFEIVEEIDHQTDGSGNFSYLVNMSQSREKLNALLSLDSVNGLRVPKKADIERQIERGKSLLMQADGISQVVVTRDYSQYIFNIRFHYDSIQAMNRAAELIHTEMSPYGKEYHSVFKTDRAGWFRQADEHTIAFIQNLKRKNPTMLNEAKYTTVYRFSQQAYSPDLDAKTAGNKKAIMYSYNLAKLASDPSIFKQNIQLK